MGWQRKEEVTCCVSQQVNYCGQMSLGLAADPWETAENIFRVAARDNLERSWKVPLPINSHPGHTGGGLQSPVNPGKRSPNNEI